MYPASKDAPNGKVNLLILVNIYTLSIAYRYFIFDGQVKKKLVRSYGDYVIEEKNSYKLTGKEKCGDTSYFWYFLNGISNSLPCYCFKIFVKRLVVFNSSSWKFLSSLDGSQPLKCVLFWSSISPTFFHFCLFIIFYLIRGDNMHTYYTLLCQTGKFYSSNIPTSVSFRIHFSNSLSLFQ